MKKIILLTSVVVLCFGIITESRAACNGNDQICGTNCCYSKDAENNYVFYRDPDAPAGEEAIITNPVNANNGEGDYQDAITAKIEYGITQIGNNAFDRSRKLVSIDIPNSITTIAHDAFWEADSLENIELPDSVTTIGDTIFGNYSQARCQLKSILLPEKLQNIDNRAFILSYLPEGFTVYCKNKTAEQCKALLTKNGGNTGLNYGDGTGCAKVSGNLGCTECTTGNLLGTEGNCVSSDKCIGNFKKNEKYCNRIRYTPAEAAPLLNDNNNSVTITFKK